MSPAWIRPRAVVKSSRNPTGKTYQVLYRRGGRGYRILTAGTFKTQKDAKLRRDLVGGWLAQGLNPKDELAKLAAEPQRTKTLAQWADTYRASRVDYSDSSTVNMAAHLTRILLTLGDRDPRTLTVGDVQEWVAAQSDLKPSSLDRYIATFRMLLDFADVTPNVARDRRVKLPTIVHEEPQPPTAAHVLAILDNATVRWRLPFVTMEQTAMATGEIETLAWGDVDVAGCQFRLRRQNVKAQIRSRARWVQVPEWLMDIIAATCPLEDRVPERRVFQGYQRASAKNALARACRNAGIPVYSAHDLRHRRLSLWHGQGIPAKELAARAGHSKASMTLDVYSHVMPLDEIPAETLKRLLVVTR